jgi:hypothetical protein
MTTMQLTGTSERVSLSVVIRLMRNGSVSLGTCLPS